MGARALKVTAVVLNWKRAQDTIACVRSIRDTSPETAVIVVDNASGDGSAQEIRGTFPDIALLENEENLGYAGGNNVGIRAALASDAEAIFVLNNDVVVQPGCVEELSSFLENEDRDCGIVGTLSLLPDGKTVDFLTANIDLRAMAVIAHGRDEPWDRSELPRVTDYVTGSALFINVDLFRRWGDFTFDEAFFLVWEDVDLSLRVGQSPLDGRMVVPRAQVLHGRSVSFGGEGSPLYQYFYVRNSFLIVEKHAGRFRKRRTRALLQRRYTGWLDKPETTPAIRRAIELGLEHGLAGRWGPPPDEIRSL